MRITCSCLLSLFLVACGGDDGPSGPSLNATFVDLPDLGANYEYEGWLVIEGGDVTPLIDMGCIEITDGAVCSTGRFDRGNHSVAVDSLIASSASSFVLSIEPKAGDVAEPSNTKLLGGTFTDGATDLTTAFSAALDYDYATADGTFFLATPTTPQTDDEGQGVWFIDQRGPEAAAGLVMPVLAAGWKYEGWVVDTSTGTPTPVSTGTFSDPGAADDGGEGVPGPDAAPPFPGDDFINPLRDLTADHQVVISIEPDPDNDPAPFTLKPLSNVQSNYPTGGDKPQFFTNIFADNTITGAATLTQ